MIEAPQYRFIRELVASRSGNQISESQQYLIDARICRVAEEAGFSSLPDFVAYLQKNSLSPYADRVAEALTINETSFFRDVRPYEALKKHVLPEIIGRNTVSRRLNIWSAACASGQEPYSIAMITSEFPELSEFFTQILASDYAEEMVEKTRRGVYSDFELSRGISSSTRDRFFQKKDSKWHVKPSLAAMVQCTRINLNLLPPNLPTFDIVFLRNVLLYFDRDTKVHILRSVRDQIDENGYLFLGGGETIIGLDVPFRSVSHNGTTLYRPI